MATHGYFLENLPSTPSSDPTTGFDMMGLDRLKAAAQHNLSLRSGLAFAGANTTLRGGILPPDAEDGLLTTHAASVLNLAATQLVVASACQTARGDVMVGEGVMGLRRSFVLAGAQTLVMSLWSVSDVSTAILMKRFYDNLLTRNMGRADALKESQYYVRDLTIRAIRDSWLSNEIIEEIRQRSEATGSYLRQLQQMEDGDRPFEHPRHWGAFICQGNPGPLPEEALMFLRERKGSIEGA